MLWVLIRSILSSTKRTFSWTIKYHYETPIQIYWKFYHQKKNKIFQIKKSDIFHISAQNIDYGYALELPQWGSSNEYPQSMF